MNFANILLNVLNVARNILFIMILLHVILPYFLPYGNKIRSTIAVVIEPLLGIIRKYVKPFRGIDFSPAILYLAIQVVFYLLLVIINFIF